VSIVRSSAAEYLTFVAGSGQGGVEAVYADENVSLTQKMMATLYDVETHTINYHLKKVFSDSELQEDSVIRNFRITAADGKTYNTKHYSLRAIIAVGYKVNSERAIQFRKWATSIVEQFTIKAYVMDDERIKSGGSLLTHQLLQEPARQVLPQRGAVHHHQPEPVRVQPGQQQRDGHPDPPRRGCRPVPRCVRGSPAHHPPQRGSPHLDGARDRRHRSQARSRQ
jgi:hypothetical protein